MKHSMRSRPWLVMGAFLVLWGWVCWAAVEANAAPADLAYYQQAKINWRQFEGQKLTIGLNKHQYTESLLPLITEFEALTGVKGDYLILPENEYGAKLTADLSNQRGEFTVIMAGAMRNWAYVPAGWMAPLEQFLNDPKLTDRSWYKLEDFFPSLIAAPDGVVLPANLEDVQLIVNWAKANTVPLIMRGACTGLSGGAVAEQGGVIVAFSRMNHILEFDPVGRTVVVEPGMVNQVLDEMVKKEGFYFPPDPSSGRSATLRGNVAENAGGPHCFKYGVTTNYLTGLEVVLSNGHTLQLGGQALDAPGYDFVGLLTGSEGTLGIITKISARIIAAPPAVMTLLATFDSVEQAGEAVSAVIAGGLVPATMEMMDQKTIHIIEDFAHAGLPTEAGVSVLIIETDGYPASVGPQMEEVAAILRQHGAGELRLAKTEAERAQIWYARKSAAGAFARLAPATITIDCTVLRSKLAFTLVEIIRICDAADLQVGLYIPRWRWQPASPDPD